MYIVPIYVYLKSVKSWCAIINILLYDRVGIRLDLAGYSRFLVYLSRIPL